MDGARLVAAPEPLMTPSNTHHVIKGKLNFSARKFCLQNCKLITGFRQRSRRWQPREMLLHQLRRDRGSQQLPQMLLPGLDPGKTNPALQSGAGETCGSLAFKLKAEASKRTNLLRSKQEFNYSVFQYQLEMRVRDHDSAVATGDGRLSETGAFHGSG